MLGKIVLVLGILGILLGLAVTVISASLPILNEGRTSWEEALFGIVPGVVVLLISFFIAVIGLVLVILARKKKTRAQ